LLKAAISSGVMFSSILITVNVFVSCSIVSIPGFSCQF
jgi:hypothetical protein